MSHARARREYYPEAQSFLVRNLDVSLRQHGRELTAACGVLAFVFVFTTAGARAVLARLVLSPLVERAVSDTLLRVSALGLSVAAIFLLYRFLPNCRVLAYVEAFVLLGGA